MKPKDLFGLGVRLLGLIFLYHGLMNVPTLFVALPFAILPVIFFLVVAWWLIGGASMLVERAYPVKTPAQTETTPKSAREGHE